MFGSLRVKLALTTLVLLALGAFAAAWYVRSRLATPYEESVQAQLQSVGRTLALDLDGRQLRHPFVLQQRLERVRKANPDLLSVSVYGRDGVLVAAAHPQAAAAATLAQRRQARKTALSGYGLSPLERERRATPLRNRSPHTAELSTPIRGAIGDVVLRLDRTRTDTALALER